VSDGRPATVAGHFARAIRRARGHESAVAAISEKDYETRAYPELSALVDALDAFPDELFAELAGDVLTIEFDDRSRYVINSHLAARQIWLAAERSAWHFDPDPSDRWIDRKSGAELWAKVGELIAAKLGRAVTFERPSRR
jgi:iron-sulfur cluster assembly protein CyaY